MRIGNYLIIQLCTKQKHNRPKQDIFLIVGKLLYGLYVVLVINMPTFHRIFSKKNSLRSIFLKFLALFLEYLVSQCSALKLKKVQFQMCFLWFNVFVSFHEFLHFFSDFRVLCIREICSSLCRLRVILLGVVR